MFGQLLKRIARKIRKILFPPLSPEQIAERKRKQDYEFLKSKGVETEYGYVSLCGEPIININKAAGARIIIGKGVTLVSDSKCNPAGINHPVILSAEGPNAIINIENGVGMSGTSVVANVGIEIGKNSMLGANTNVYDNDFHIINPALRLVQKSTLESEAATVIIGENCWLASGVTVLKGVHIGNNSVIGAMSLVNKDIPENCIAAGIPAKVIRNI